MRYRPGSRFLPTRDSVRSKNLMNAHFPKQPNGAFVCAYLHRKMRSDTTKGTENQASRMAISGSC
jgi:hypothetical protein